MTDRNRAAVGVALYVALAAAWIYGWADREWGDASGAFVAALAFLAVTNVVCGAIVRRWWAVAFPLLPALVAVPAGYPPVEGGEPWPIWFALLYLALPEAALVALGVAVAKRLRTA